MDVSRVPEVSGTQPQPQTLPFTRSEQGALLQKGSHVPPQEAAAPSPPKNPFLPSRVCTEHGFSQLPVLGQLVLMS